MGLLLLAAAVLACPFGMGAMMWMTTRGGHQDDVRDMSEGEQAAQLHAEVEQLKADRSVRAAAER